MKYLLGIVVGLVALVAGLFIVFKFVVQPKSAPVASAPRPTINAPQSNAPPGLGTTLGGVAAIVTAAGGLYENIFGAANDAA